MPRVKGPPTGRRRKKRKKPVRRATEMPVQQLWAKPDPTSVFSLARAAMQQAEDAIFAQAMRKLAKAEANGLDIEPEDVIEWLGAVQQDITWLIDHIRTNLHVQRDIEALIVPDKRRRCEWCDRWFVLARSDSAFCSGKCRQAAYRDRRRYG